MEKKNQVLMTVLGVFALVIVTVGVSYAFFTYTRTSTNTGEITTGSLDFGFTETASQDVKLENAMPIANGTAEAATLTATTENVAVYDFEVAYHTTGDVATTYSISLVEQGTAADAAFKNVVKVALFEDGVNLGTKTLTDALANSWTQVTNKTIADGDEKEYKLKMWIDASLTGFEADDETTGTLTPEEGDNYTSTDGQTATWAHAGKSVSVKVKVDATGTAQ